MSEFANSEYVSVNLNETVFLENEQLEIRGNGDFSSFIDRGMSILCRILR